eukprot:6475606-Amphidinium_carterae.2
MSDFLPVVDIGNDTIISVSVGYQHSCALLIYGEVKCWGDNEHGQLGLGDSVPRGGNASDLGTALSIVDLGRGAVVTSIAAGANFTCALLETGGVKCWGDNCCGQLGIDDVYGRGYSSIDMGDALPAIDLGADAVAISVGASFACALLDTAQVL